MAFPLQDSPAARFSRVCLSTGLPLHLCREYREAVGACRLVRPWKMTPWTRLVMVEHTGRASGRGNHTVSCSCERGDWGSLYLIGEGIHGFWSLLIGWSPSCLFVETYPSGWFVRCLWSSGCSVQGANFANPSRCMLGPSRSTIDSIRQRFLS